MGKFANLHHNQGELRSFPSRNGTRTYLEQTYLTRLQVQRGFVYLMMNTGE